MSADPSQFSGRGHALPRWCYHRALPRQGLLDLIQMAVRYSLPHLFVRSHIFTLSLFDPQALLRLYAVHVARACMIVHDHARVRVRAFTRLAPRAVLLAFARREVVSERVVYARLLSRVRVPRSRGSSRFGWCRGRGPAALPPPMAVTLGTTLLSAQFARIRSMVSHSPFLSR